MMRLLGLGVLLGIALVVGPGHAQTGALDAVSVQLKWHHQTQFAGNYVADAKRFYRAEGLTVENRPWRVGSPSPIDEVLAGRATVGITSQAQFLVAAEKGAPVVAIAAIYQKSPVGFFALRSSGVKRPTDFARRSIAFAPTHEIHLRAMLKRVGLDMNAVRRVPYSFDLAPFWRGEIDVLGGYVMNQPVDSRLAGHEVTIVFPDDYGVHMYDDVVFTTDQALRDNAAMVERWLRATLRGWRYAIEHPDEATEITLRVDPSRQREKELAMLLASIPLIHTGERPIGWMTPEVWQGAAEILLDQKILTRAPEIDTIYTTRFLERVHRR